MARLSKSQWGSLRVDYEVHGMTLSQLSEKYGADRGNISKRSKKYNWQREKVQQIISDKVNVAKTLNIIEEKSTTLDSTTIRAIDKEVSERLELEGYFTNSIKLNQSMANKKLKAAGANAELADLDTHSRLTNRNKDGVMGKPQTQVNIQNNVTTDADAVIAKLMERHSHA